MYVCLMTVIFLCLFVGKNCWHTMITNTQLYDIPIVYGYVTLPTRLLISVVSAINTRGMY